MLYQGPNLRIARMVYQATPYQPGTDRVVLLVNGMTRAEKRA